MGYLATFQQLVAKLPARAHSPLRAKDSYRLQLTWALKFGFKYHDMSGFPAVWLQQASELHLPAYHQGISAYWKDKVAWLHHRPR
jgi:hypothetical protein